MLLYTIILAGLVTVSLWRFPYGVAVTAFEAVLYILVVAGNVLYSFDRILRWGPTAAKILLPTILLQQIVTWFVDRAKSKEPESTGLMVFSLCMIVLTILPTCIAYFKIGFLHAGTCDQEQ